MSKVDGILTNLFLQFGSYSLGKYVIKSTKNDGYVFNLYADNGKVIGTSQTYKSQDSAKNGVESVKKNAKSEIEEQD